MSNNLVIPHIKSDYFEDNPYVNFSFIQNKLNDTKYIYQQFDNSYDQTFVSDMEGYTYEDYLIDELTYKGDTSKGLVYNIKYYKYIEPDGTYVYECDWWNESFTMNFSCQNTRYDYIKFDYSHSDNFSFIHIRMYPIWGGYVSPFENHATTGSFKITQNDAFGPMGSGIENRTEDKEILYLTVHSPNNEEKYKFKCIKYPKKLSLSFYMSNQSDKSKQYLDLNSDSQTAQKEFSFWGEEEDLIVENNTSFIISYNITKITISTRGVNHRLSITVSENDTGETRTGSLFLKTSNGTEERKAELFVTQLWYVPQYAYINSKNIKTAQREMTSNRLIKISATQKTFTVRVKSNTTVLVRKSTQYSNWTWPEFVEEIEGGELTIEGNDQEQTITFNVISENNTTERKQGYIEFAMHDIYDNKTYKLGFPIQQMPMAIE